SRIVSQDILYGTTAQWLMPDLWRTDFAVILGANPIESKGGMVNEPLLREALRNIVGRGGRVVVIDPRRTETAKQYEHLPVRPGGDPWLLAGMIQVILETDLVDKAFIASRTTGLSELGRAVGEIELEVCAERSGVPLAELRQLAVDFARSPSALIYGRTGTCTQRFGTLTNLLQDTLMAITGNIG